MILALSLTGSVTACATGCPTALAQGELVKRGPNLELQEEGQARMIAVNWPSGYSSRPDGEILVLVDRFGSVKARQGDIIGMGGGEGADGVFQGCGDVWVVRPG